MRIEKPFLAVGALALGLALSGCVSFSQDKSEVLVFDPNFGRYDAPAEAPAFAARHWEYASMADRAYEIARERARIDSGKAARPDPDQPVACGDLDAPPRPTGFDRWDNFPDAELSDRMRRHGLFLWVAERQGKPREIVVVFEGTNFREIPDWTSNFRWFLRFVPGVEDQYTLTARDVAKQFRDRLLARPDRYRLDANDPTLRDAAGEPIRIVSAGHSLGGGLAQHFAYAFVQSPVGARGPRVEEVYAFDPSPVTGWTTAFNPPRDYNASGLRINRIFEHGEALAYVRLFTSRLVISAKDPAVWEYRYNFDPKFNVIRNHSMRSLACGLYLAAHPAKPGPAAAAALSPPPLR